MQRNLSFLPEENEKDGQAGELRLLEIFPETTHDFQERLEASESIEKWAFYLKALSKFFPGAGSDWKRIISLLEQRQGNDLTLAQKKIQIKYREKDYGDILLEYVHEFHNSDRTMPGWIELDHDIDYLMYTIPSASKAVLLNWKALRLLWKENGEQWKERYFNSRARNQDYYSIGVCVPWEEVKEAIVNTYSENSEA